MAAPIGLGDFDSVSLRRLAKRTRDAEPSSAGVGLSTAQPDGCVADRRRRSAIIRDWVLRFKRPRAGRCGAPSKLNADHRRALAEVVDGGTASCAGGAPGAVARHLASSTTVGRELKRRQDLGAAAPHAQRSPPNWRRSRLPLTSHRPFVGQTSAGYLGLNMPSPWRRTSRDQCRRRSRRTAIRPALDVDLATIARVGLGLGAALCSTEPRRAREPD